MKIVIAILPVFVLLWSEPQTAFKGSLVHKADPSAPGWLLVPKGMDIAAAEGSASAGLRTGRLRLPVRGDSASVFQDLAMQYLSQGFVIAEVMEAQSKPGRPYRMLSAWEQASGRHATMLGVKDSRGDTLVITYREVAEKAAADVRMR